MEKEEFLRLIIVVPTVVIVITLLHLAAGKQIGWTGIFVMIICAIIGAGLVLLVLRRFSRKDR